MQFHCNAESFNLSTVPTPTFNFGGVHFSLSVSVKGQQWLLYGQDSLRVSEINNRASHQYEARKFIKIPYPQPRFLLENSSKIKTSTNTQE